MATDIAVTGYPNPRTGVGLSSGVDGMDEHLLAAGHYITAPLPLHLNYPRPDSETPAYARNRNFHSDFRYEFPIEVEGGAWPYQYILLDAPAGTTLGENLGDADYGVLKWTPSGQTGTVKFAVMVVDQDGNKITAAWSASLNNARFTFINQAAAASGTGSISSPLKLFSDWYISAANASFNNQILVWRAGTYTALGDTGNVNVDYATKTPSWVGYPDEVVEFDCTGAVFITDAAIMSDIFVYNLLFKNARQDIANSRYWYIRSDVLNRVLFSKCTFKDMPNGGTTGNDNAGPIFVSSNLNNKNYIAVTKCLFDNIISRQFNGHYVDFYNASHVLVADNYVKNCSTDYGFYMKYTNEYVTVRNNLAFENNLGRQITLGMGMPLSRYHEVCYNRCVIPIGHADSCFTAAMDNTYAANIQSNYIYRNTFVGGRFVLRFMEADPVKFNANVIVASNTTTDIPTSCWVANIASNEIDFSATDLVNTSTGLLTGAGLVHLGTKGAEIA